MAQRVFGITGGIASGKSQVELFLSRFFPVIDADQVAREVVAPGSEGLAAVVAAFGEGVLLANGGLDRGKMRGLISRDREAQLRLNGILHPRIGVTILEKLEALGDALPVFVSAALMIESGSYKRYEAVILVTAPLEIRVRRLLVRDGMDEALARQLIEKQMPDEEKRRFATVEVVNDGDLACLESRVRACLQQLKVDLPQAGAAFS